MGYQTSMAVVDNLVLQKVEKYCSKCNICGGGVIAQSAFEGWHFRICCENYKVQPPHGNLAHNCSRLRFTNWTVGYDNVYEAIKQWNEEVNR